MKYRGIFEYEYPTEHKPPVSIDVHLHGDCVKGKIIEWEYRPLEQEPKTGHWIRWYEQNENEWYIENIPHCKCSECGKEYDTHSSQFIKYCSECGAKMVEPQESEEE